MSVSVVLKRIIYSIRQWFQPYWVPPPIESKKHTTDTPSSQETVETVETVEETQSTETPQPQEVSERKPNKKERYPSVGPGETLMQPREWMIQFGDARLAIQEFDHRLVLDPTKLDRLPAPNWSWYYHDEKVHQLLSHLGPTMGYKFKERDSKERKTLKPLIRITDRQYDRTHLIPFGYHGLEADPRLLIGFDSDQNRGPMNDYEIQQKSWNFPIFWACEVTHDSDKKMTLTYTVWDARTLRRISQKSFVTRGDIDWR